MGSHVVIASLQLNNTRVSVSERLAISCSDPSTPSHNPSFPHPPQRILQELAGQVPWVQAWYDRMKARPALVAALQYRETSMEAYEKRKETGEKAPNSAML